MLPLFQTLANYFRTFPRQFYRPFMSSTDHKNQKNSPLANHISSQVLKRTHKSRRHQSEQPQEFVDNESINND